MFLFRKPETCPQGETLGQANRMLWVLWKERAMLAMGRELWMIAALTGWVGWAIWAWWPNP